MKKLIPLLLSLLLAIPAGAKEPRRVLEAVVTKVSDGDTIQVTDPLGTKVKVRLYGIDAPETEKVNRKTRLVSKLGQPYGAEAFGALRAKVDGQRVRVEVLDVDRYRRAVGIVTAAGRDVNAEMIRDGWAWAYREYLDRPYTGRYIALEEQARKARRGLWQQSNPQPPWEFRKVQRMR